MQFLPRGSNKRKVLNTGCGDCSDRYKYCRTVWRRKMKYKHHTYRRRKPSFLLVLPFFMLLLMTVSTKAQTAPVCERTVKADVVALDQVIVYNRLGTVNPG